MFSSFITPAYPHSSFRRVSLIGVPNAPLPPQPRRGRVGVERSQQRDRCVLPVLELVERMMGPPLPSEDGTCDAENPWERLLDPIHVCPAGR